VVKMYSGHSPEHIIHNHLPSAGDINNMWRIDPLNKRRFLKIVINHCPQEAIYGRNNVVLHTNTRYTSIYNIYVYIIVIARGLCMNDNNKCFELQKAAYDIIYSVLPAVKDVQVRLLLP